MIDRIRSALRALKDGDRIRHEIDEEMEFHIDELAQDLMRKGMAPEAARREARHRFGTAEHVHEGARREMGVAPLDEIVRNVRFAFRSMRRSPALTGAFILTLGLCIGFGTAVFSAVDAVLWKPLPYPQAERLAMAGLYDPARGELNGRTSVDGQSWLRIQEEAEGFQAAVYSGWAQGVNLSADGAARYVMQQRVSADFFATLGVPPFMGREFSVAEDVPGGPPIAVLSHELWTETFRADPDILGTTIRLKGEPHTVVGVMPEEFRSDAEVDIWTPLQATTSGEGSGANFTAIVRLPPGMDWDVAKDRFRAIAPPDGMSTDVLFGLVPLDAAMSSAYRLPLLVLLTAVALMILVGCANLASIQVSRALARDTELSTRRALGSGVGALVRQLVTENLVLGALGGLTGIGIAALTVDGLTELFRTNLGLTTEIALDGRALMFALLLTGAATVLFGLAPLLQVVRTDALRLLVAGTRGITGGRSRWLRQTLLVGEVAMVTVLLFSAALLARSHDHLASLEPGFEPEGVWTAQLSLDDARFGAPEAMDRLFTRTLDELRTMPGVTNAAVALSLPYERPLNMPFRLPTDEEDARPRLANFVYVTPAFFETLGIPIRDGRSFDLTDRADTQPVAVVSEGLAATHLSDVSAIGARLSVGGGDEVEVVGIVGDVQQGGGGWGTRQPVGAAPTVYIPATQAAGPMLQQIHVWFSPSWIVRAGAASPQIATGMARILEAQDDGLPVARTASLEQVMEDAFAQTRFQAAFLLIVAGFALLLAGVGLYGIVSHEVQQRRREMGVRMALGVSPGRAVMTTGLSGVRLAALGLLVGGVAAAGAGRVLASLIWGVTPSDPVTILALVAGIGLLALVASFVPATRMGRLDPAAVLRE